MNELQRSAAKAIVKTDSAGKGIGAGLMAIGGGGIGLVLAAAFIPFVGVLGLSVALGVLGLLLYVMG